jgi:hypothetical protein
MSADILNLRLARKRRERLAKEEEAARNRRLHGETKAVRDERRLSGEKASRDLDAHRREPSGSEPRLPRPADPSGRDGGSEDGR